MKEVREQETDELKEKGGEEIGNEEEDGAGR
jgi:hypothetical protein